MPGMMSEQDLASLDSSVDADFEDRWLRMMIAHHEGAIEMARTEQSQGEYADATALADNIASDQAQAYFANGNNEWPTVKSASSGNEALASLGEFKADKMATDKMAARSTDAQKLLDNVGYK